MFLLVSVRHVGAHPDELQHGVSIQSSINLGTTFPQISRIRIIPSTQILATVFVYLPPFISQILDFTCRMVLIFILIYFEWRDTENQRVSFTWRSTKVKTQRQGNNSSVIIVGVEIVGKPFFYDGQSELRQNFRSCVIWAPLEDGRVGVHKKTEKPL